jgi:chorismate-pyruvate lyase
MNESLPQFERLQNHYTKSQPRIDYDIFRTRGFSPDELLRERVQLAELPPLLRILLLTAGASAPKLEAYHWEPIGSDRLEQEVLPAAYDIECLEVERGQALITSRVQLRGMVSGRVHARIAVVLVASVLPQPQRRLVSDGLLGADDLLRSSGLETHRELLDLGHCGDPLGFPRGSTAQEHVFRSYLVVHHGEPAALVTEYFPCFD